LAIPDREHYDSVIEIQVVPSGNNTPNDSEVVPSGNNTPNDSEVVPSGNNTPNDSEENERESIVTPEKQTSRKQRYITITPSKICFTTKKDCYKKA
jgi:hypothetical protein